MSRALGLMASNEFEVKDGVLMPTEQEVLNDIRERLVRVETKLDAQNDLRKRVDDTETKATETESRSKSNTHRLDKLEANLTWLWRTVVGAIVAAGVSAIVVFK